MTGRRQPQQVYSNHCTDDNFDALLEYFFDHKISLILLATQHTDAGNTAPHGDVGAGILAPLAGSWEEKCAELHQRHRHLSLLRQSLRHEQQPSSLPVVDSAIRHAPVRIQLCHLDDLNKAN